ncbi:MAG: sugar ABC transporter permease [Blautia sp.]|nr:sugar ABC transporter permease [Blautia sp.]
MNGTRTKKRKLKKSDLALLVMLLPGSIYLLVNNYAPMFGMFIAFKKINYQKGIFGSDWVGFDNFEYLFKTKDAWIMTRNTLLYNLVFIALNIILGVAFAIMLNEIRHALLKKGVQTVLLMPQIVSMVIVSYMVFAFLSSDNGFINHSILEPLGKGKISWYTQAAYWPFILIFVQAWKNIGYNTLLFLASVVGIDKSLYEAAEVDGASRMQQIRYITLPLLKPAMITLGLLMVGRIFYSDFGLFYQVPMDSGPLLPVTQTIDTYVYRGLTNISNIGMSSAASFYQSIVGFVVVLTCNLIVRRTDKDSALF